MILDSNFAQDLFDAHHQKSLLEDKLYDYIQMEVLGVEEDVYPFEEATYDWYDCSVELKDCDPNIELNQEQLEKLWKIGFSQCWVCYKEPVKYKDTYLKERHYGMNSFKYAISDGCTWSNNEEDFPKIDEKIRDTWNKPENITFGGHYYVPYVKVFNDDEIWVKQYYTFEDYYNAANE